MLGIYAFASNQEISIINVKILNKILKLAISNRAYYSVKWKMINQQKKSQKLVSLMSVEKKMKNFQKFFPTISEKKFGVS